MYPNRSRSIFRISSLCLAEGAEQNRDPQGFVLWARPPLGAQPMWSAVGIRGHTPHNMDHLRAVFNALRDARLFGNLEKCIFCTDRVSFLGYVVTPQGIEVDEMKIEAIKSWPVPQTVTQVRSFLGLAGFYHRFVKDFITIAAPLHELTKKGVVFHPGEAQEESFDTLKDTLTHAPLLQLPNFGKTFELEYDASGVGIGGVLMQDGKPVVYFSENTWSCS